MTSQEEYNMYDLYDNPNSFSNLGNTWTKESSLEMGDGGKYDPYPELLSKIQREQEHIRERYSGYSDDSCCDYAQSYGIRPKLSGVPNLSYSVGVAQENYTTDSCCNCGSYTTVPKTWSKQRWYEF